MTSGTDSAIPIDFANGDHIAISAFDASARTDVWVQCFDGIYRFFLAGPQIAELERKCGLTDREGTLQPRGILNIYGRVAKGRYEMDGQSISFAVEGEATLAECRETVRLALIGGACALVDGERVAVSAQRAAQLVTTYLVPSPVQHSWNLSYLALHTAVHGRPQSAAEVGVPSHHPVYPDEPATPEEPA